MGFGWNFNTLLTLGALVISVAGSILIIRVNWKQYGLLFIVSGIVGVVLCYVFIALHLYSFPFRLFPSFSPIPILIILTFFPFEVLFCVRYSPQQWRWKIPFYWVMVHLGVSAELIIEQTTDIIRYNTCWGIWDSYVWWWLFLLVFEWLGGLIVKPQYRKPIPAERMRYSTFGWFIIHFILIVTIFLAGLYAGITLLK